MGEAWIGFAEGRAGYLGEKQFYHRTQECMLGASEAFWERNFLDNFDETMPEHLQKPHANARAYGQAFKLIKPGGVAGTIGGILLRSMGLYRVSRSTGMRPAARIRRSSSARGVNSAVVAPASW